MAMTYCLYYETITAKKDYHCNACEWLLDSGYSGMGLSISELRQVAKAKRQGWKILKGQKYKKAVSVENGEFYTFRAIPEIDDICAKHDYYEH